MKNYSESVTRCELITQFDNKFITKKQLHSSICQLTE